MQTVMKLFKVFKAELRKTLCYKISSDFNSETKDILLHVKLVSYVRIQKHQLVCMLDMKNLQEF